MRLPPLALPHVLATAATLALAASLPLACAQGTQWNGITGGLNGNGGAGGTTTSASGMGGMGGMGGASVTSGASPDGTSTSASGSPTASSAASTSAGTTSGFPSTSATTGAGASSASSSAATTTAASSTTSTSSGGPSSACDVGNCFFCTVICGGSGSSCPSEYDACSNDLDCSVNLCCFSATPCAPNDDACVQSCLSEDPAGATLFNAYVQCMACTCVETCGVAAGTCP